MDKEVLILNSILNSTPTIVYLYNLDKSDIQFLNHGIYSQLGYDKFESDKISFDEYVTKIHQDDRENFKNHITSVQSGREKKYTTIEYRLEMKNGQWKWYSDSIFPLATDNLVNRELVGYATDISGIRKKEDKYLWEEIRLHAILDNTREYYFFLDSNYKLISLNKNAKDFLFQKFSRNMFEGYSVLEFLPLETVEIFTDNFQYALKGNTIQYESSFAIEENEMKWYQFRYLPIRDQRKRIIGICFVVMDITDVRKSNENLKELNRNLEDRVIERTKALNEEVIQRKNTEDKLLLSLEKEKELNELKSKFITLVSHEFKTPMTAISMSTQILEDYGENYSKSERDKHYHRIKEAIKSLNNLMEGALSISRAEASNIPFQPSLIDINIFLQNLISNFESIYPENKFELIVPDLYKKFLYLDTNLISHILENLLSNSIKYSPEKNLITLELVLKENLTEFIVKDRGLGIPKEDQEQIFQTFYRGKNVGNISGTGLGLNVVKNFVDLHGGSVYFKSSIQDGTQFHVIIPTVREIQ